MTRRANFRSVLLLTLAALWVSATSGCNLGGGSLTTPNPTPTPGNGVHSVSLNWSASPSNNLQGYKVYRSQVSGGPYSGVSQILGVSTQQFTDSSVSSGQRYFYVITSVDNTGLESGPSPEVNTTIPN